ncbi:DUF948 domain-containing protein [Paenibacillus sp. EPM92]|uniref:DUF948 domain-containing protein n=1 Tax=Paenibacillus sp. EPM92 TaxID=1561195 RepID=UPI001914DA97|nr:DUF948 domain-containing protein [Paenibacillus sp. EPM92]
MIIEISVAVVAIAFAALVVFLIQTLRSVSDLLGQTNMVIREMQEQMNGISTEAVELLRHTNEVSVDVRNKLHSIDSVVDSVKNIGDAVQEVTSSVKQASTAVAGTIRNSVPKDPKTAGETAQHVLQTVPIVIELWQKWRERKKAEKSARPDETHRTAVSAAVPNR